MILGSQARHCPFPIYFLASRGVVYDVYACRRAHFLFYSLLFFLSDLLFGIAGNRFSMSMDTYIITILLFTLFFLSNLLFGIGGRRFRMADRNILLACRRTPSF